PVVELRLFDSNTNKSFSHVTYYIIIEKDGKRLLADLFHDHNGDLRIQINPSNSSQVSISGQQDPLLGTYIATPDSHIMASGPIFIKGGLYHFIVRIATVDSDSTLLPDNQEPIYDSWLSIGNTVNQQINVNGKQIPIKVISYYDKLTSFRFDDKNMQMQFNMPFNWNVSRINNTNIFVHEEVYVPNPTPFTANKSFAGSVNGIDVSKVKGASNPSTQKPYNPSPANIAVGRTVLWINNDNTAHTVTEGNPSGNTPLNGFDSGILGPGQTFKHVFDKPGTVGYYCRLH